MTPSAAARHQRPRSARAYAVSQLERIEQEGAFVGLAGDDDTGLDARDERQATEYVAGVTRWRRWLDFLLARYYRGQLDTMEQTLRQVLRVGLYDLLFLQTPPHAALNEAVELAKQLVRPGAGGLVNALLRNALRDQEALPQPDTGDPARDLAIRQSHPTWMVRRWLERFGPEDTAALLAWNNARPVFGLRVNPLKISRADLIARLAQQGVEAEPSALLDDFVRVQRLQTVFRAGLLDEGLVTVQDESAGLVVRLLDPQPGERLIDSCAAPGGKALYAAARMQNTGAVLAFDLHARRLRLVDRAARRLGIDIVPATAGDLRVLAAAPGAPDADRVLLDVPCSGLGVLAKRADLRWNRTVEALQELTALQDELLDAAARLVRPGGLLVYSTCTIEPEENQDRVAAFLTRHSDFAAEPAGALLPPEVVTPDGCLATLPHRHRTDGAFGARLRRTA